MFVLTQGLTGVPNKVAGEYVYAICICVLVYKCESNTSALLF